MSEKINHQQAMDDQEILELRLKSEQNSMEQALKPGFLGKLSTKKVIEYINTLRAQWQQAERTYTNHINDLTREKEQMMFELKSMRDQLNGRQKVIEERNQLRQKVIGLEEKVVGYEKYVDDVQEKVVKFESELEKSIFLREKNKTHQETIEQLNHQIEVLTNDLNLRDDSQKNTIEENEKLLQKVKQFEAANSVNTTSKLNEEIRKLKKTNQLLQQSNQTINEKMDGLESKFNHLTSEHKQQVDENIKLKKDVDERKKQIADLLNDKSILEKQTIALSKQLEDIKTGQSALKNERDDLKAKIDKQQTERKQLSEALKAITELRTKMQEINGTMEQRIADLQKELFKNHDNVLDEIQLIAKKTSQMMIASAQQETAQLKDGQKQYMDSLLSSYTSIYERISPMISTLDMKDELGTIHLK